MGNTSESGGAGDTGGNSGDAGDASSAADATETGALGDAITILTAPTNVTAARSPRLWNLGGKGPVLLRHADCDHGTRWTNGSLL
jgi:hypothetical protein